MIALRLWLGLGLILLSFILYFPAFAFSEEETEEIKLDVETQCLAENIYFEARGESLLGQLAVAMVTMNRVIGDRNPNAICDVVWETYFPGTKLCQFSWTCDGIPDLITDAHAWIVAVNIAQFVVGNWDHIIDPTCGSTNYNRFDITPSYITPEEYIYTTQIDDHVFYKWMPLREDDHTSVCDYETVLE